MVLNDLDRSTSKFDLGRSRWIPSAWLAVYPVTDQRRVWLAVYPITDQMRVWFAVYPITDQRRVWLAVYPVTDQRSAWLAVYPVTHQRRVWLAVHPVTDQRRGWVAVYPVTEAPLTLGMLTLVSRPVWPVADSRPYIRHGMAHWPPAFISGLMRLMSESETEAAGAALWWSWSRAGWRPVLTAGRPEWTPSAPDRLSTSLSTDCLRTDLMNTAFHSHRQCYPSTVHNTLAADVVLQYYNRTSQTPYNAKAKRDE